MSHLGTYFVGDRLLFTVNTHNNKGNVADAASVPFYNIYREETQNAIFTGTMSKLDDAGTTGYYSEIVGLTGIFTPGWYSIYAQASVSNVIGSISYTFSISSGTATNVNVTQISGDAGAADNLEAQFDGTGLSGDTYPSTQAQLSSLSISGAPSYEAPSSYVLVTGTQSAGTYANVDTSNAVYHTHTDNGGLLDLYYEYSLAGDEIATDIVFKGRITGINDSVFVQAYDWTTLSWATLFTLAGTVGSTDTIQTPVLVNKYTGTGSLLGKVRIRVVNAVTLSTATLYVDQLIVGKTITSRTVGYQNGAVWIDTVNGTSGTASWVNGTADNPVLTLAEAYTIANDVGLNSFYLSAGSTITLTQPANNTRFVGAAVIDLNGQAIADAYFEDAYTINGTSSGDDAVFKNCGIGTATIYHAYFIDCRFKGVLTFVASNEYIIIRGTDATAGAPNACQFIFSANVDAIFRDWRGGIQLNALASTNTAIIDGAGRIVINDNCTGGSITIRGFFPSVTDQVVGGFLGTVTDINRYGEDQNVWAVTDGWVSASGSAGSAPSTTDIDNALSASHGTGSWAGSGVVGTVDANVIQWRGVQPNDLQSGRVDAFVGLNNDKTGYYLADGSMAVFTGTVSTVGSVIGNVNGTVQAVVGGWVQHSGTMSGAPTTSDIDTALSISHGTGSWTSSVIGTVDANIVSSDNIDFTALQKSSLNASTPASVGTVTGNVNGSVNSVTNPVTVVGYVNVTGTVQAIVIGYVQVTGTVDANVEKWNTVDVVSGAIPAFVAGSVGGIPTVDANNFIAGIQGTKNQLDDLNDIAAGSQMDLVNAPNTTAVTAFTTDIFAEVVEGTTSFKTWLRRIGSILFGKASGGGAAGSKKFRDTTDAVNRVDIVTDSNGNRTSASFDDTNT